MNKRTISTIILLSFLASSVSCSGTANTGDDTTDTHDIVTSGEDVTTEDPRYAIKEELPDADYGGYDFRILVRWPELWCADMYSESLTGEVVNDAVFNRNRVVSERFNVNFTQIKSSDNDAYTDGTKAILAGEDAYDMILPHGQGAFHTYAYPGLLLD